MDHYTLFDSPIGVLGLAWSVQGITRVQLPERDTEATVARLDGRTFCTSPPAKVQKTIDNLVRHLSGKLQTFKEASLDFSRVPPFHQLVYQKTRLILPGRTISYGELARELGKPGAARAVGQAMARNPFPLIVPCHRVLARGGPGGFSAYGATDAKTRLLALEGVRLVVESARPATRSAASGLASRATAGFHSTGKRQL